jgi:hypothetical protein
MAGLTDLDTLIGTMRPRLGDGVYVFVTRPAGDPLPAPLRPIMSFAEAEGTTFVVDADAAAAAGLEGTFRSRLITLEVHSALDAVGFLAAVTAALAGAGIAANPVSAYFHDHLFVPADRAEAALAVLLALSESGAGTVPPRRG